MPNFLQQRRRRWYAVLEVPKDLRKEYGKRRLVKSLETESLTEAEKRVLNVVASWKHEFESIRAGTSIPMGSLEDLARDWRADLLRAKASELDTLRGVVADTAREIEYRSPKKAEAFYLTVHGKTCDIAEHIDAWLEQTDNVAKTKDMKRSDVKRLAERFSLTHTINKHDVREWAYDLQQQEGLKPATVRRIISACRGYWSFLQRMKVVDPETDPFHDVVEKRKKSKAEIALQRVAFSSSDVVKLLKEAQNKQDTALTAIIWIGMWTGCRIEEICSLRTASVQSDRFKIEDAKSRAGHRVVPIHSRLSEGLAHLVKTSADGFVVSGLTNNKYGDRSNAVGKRFGRLKSELGFDQRYVFHSIRRTVVTQLENNHVSEQISADIVGHEKQTITYGLYSGGTHFGLMQQAVERLNYPIDPLFETSLSLRN